MHVCVSSMIWMDYLHLDSVFAFGNYTYNAGWESYVLPAMSSEVLFSEALSLEVLSREALSSEVLSSEALSLEVLSREALS